MKKIIKLSIMILLLAINTGCWDKIELEEQGYVIAIGLDKAKAKNMVDVTFQMANPQVGSSSNVQIKEPSSQIITISATDFITAKDIANSSVTRNLTFSHASTIIVSEELAKSDQFNDLLLSSIRDRELRREVILLVTKERARDFIYENLPRLETRPHKYYDFMQKRWQTTGLVPYSSFNRFTEQAREKDALFIAAYASGKKEKVPLGNKSEDEFVAGQVNIRGGNPVQMVGSAVFRNGKMIGKLTGEETRLTLLLRERELADTWNETYPDPLDGSKRISIKIDKNKKTDVKVDIQNEKINIKVNVPISIQILSIRSGVNYVTDIEKQNILKQSIENDIEEKFNKLINKAQKDFKGDIFTWYVAARKNFWTVDDYENYNWLDKFSQAIVDVQAEIEIIGFGQQLEP